MFLLNTHFLITFQVGQFKQFPILEFELGRSGSWSSRSVSVHSEILFHAAQEWSGYRGHGTPYGIHPACYQTVLKAYRVQAMCLLVTTVSITMCLLVTKLSLETLQ